MTETNTEAPAEESAPAPTAPAPFRACHGCLVDGLDHNCGYTGF